MSLVANSHGSMYNGVSQQPPHMRAVDQVEEMYNCYPSIEYGLLRREPLEQPDGTIGTTPVMSSGYDNSYSNMIVDGKSVYQININNGTPEVVQLEPFYKLLRISDGITISTPASIYLKAKGLAYERSQYSTTTIKNTTLISNDAVTPMTIDRSVKEGLGWDQYALVWVKNADASMGIDYTVKIDGVSYTTDQKDRGLDSKSYGQPSANIGSTSLDLSYPAPPRPKISPRGHKWNNDLHASVDPSSQTPVYMSAAGWTAGLWYGNAWMTASDISQANAYRVAVDSRNIALEELKRVRWRRDALEAQRDKLDKWINQDIKGPTDTKTAISELSVKIRSAGYTVHVFGSMMVIETLDKEISVSDSFGNNAMSLFHREIPGTELLPAKIDTPWTFLKFKVKQETARDDVAYFIKWNGKVWEESEDDLTKDINVGTMPIEMKVQFYESGSIASIDIDTRDWDGRKVGDSITNEGPEFFNSKPIKDIFFYRNRLGFLTDDGISMTEAADHSNLWRTTAITTLDSDPIDFVVSTTSSTSLRYTVMNQDKVFILADNVQFVLDGGAVFGPKSVKVNEVSHYVLNLDVAPIVSDNKIIMIGGTDKSTIVYEYVYNESYGIAEATALTAHIPGYILKDVQCLAASNEDNMIFLVASDHRERLQPYRGNTAFRDILTNDSYDNIFNEATPSAYPERKILYTYKFTDSGNQRVQSAWSKWNYRGSVLQVAGARGVLYMDIDHESNMDQTTTVIGLGEWHMAGDWKHEDMNWNMTPEAYNDNIQLQRRFAKQSLRPSFLEAATGDYEVSASILDDSTTIKPDYKDFNEYINRSFVDLGEFTFKDRASKKYTASKSMLKALTMKSDPGSLHTIIVRDLDIGKERSIGPLNNKKFKGIGLAANYFLQDLGNTSPEGRKVWAGTTFDTIEILDTPILNGDKRGELTVSGGSFDGAFDSAEIANLDGDQVVQTNNTLPNLYGQDVPTMIGGSSASTRVVISSFYDNDRDYGFRIHDIIQEARVNQRFNLS